MVQVYTPDAAKNDFYKKLQDVFDNIPNYDLKILIGQRPPRTQNHNWDQLKTVDEKEEGSQRYARLDRLVKKSCRKDKKEWLEHKSPEAQEAADRNDSKTLYRIVHEKSNSSVPFKDKNGKLLIAQDEQNKQWIEHFQETFNQLDPTTTYDLDVEDAQDELQVNTGDITIEEVKIAIKSLKNNKAAGLDEITVEILKYGGLPMAEKLTSCSEHIFVLRNVSEQCVEYRNPLAINFVDFKKAFDSIHCECLWRILLLYGVPETFVTIFKGLYLCSNCCVKNGNKAEGESLKLSTHQYEPRMGLLSDDVLRPTNAVFGSKPQLISLENTVVIYTTVYSY
ncbi:hypothetical protein M9458_053995 [Cirrhinus mrigala]|uniref:Reverse transcriptase domain-containing protein n=1 Tax=Cirrhinus mrigala TaxID=683832 RepID=A0ABD0MQ51_CIRMR